MLKNGQKIIASSAHFHQRKQIPNQTELDRITAHLTNHQISIFDF